MDRVRGRNVKKEKGGKSQKKERQGRRRDEGASW